MAAFRELHRFPIDVSDTIGWVADDGTPPRWLAALVKDKMAEWQVADSIEFKLQRQDSTTRGRPYLQANFKVGTAFNYDAGSEVALVGRCIVQALIVYGKALSDSTQRGVYQDRARPEFRRALDQIVRDRSLLCSTKDSMAISQAVHQWLCDLKMRQPGVAYLVQS